MPATAGDVRGGWPLVWALAAAQLVSWGSLYYAFSLFVVPMEAELGWSRPAVNGALSVGLLVAGACAYPVGAWIDRHGGRTVMALGSAAGIVLLLAWSRVESLWAFYAVWAGIGAAQAATLYEPAFAVLTRRFPESFRTRITALTLIGGLASTAFIPLTQLFIGWLGWRDALVGLALCNLAVGLPVHALLLRDGARRGARAVHAARQESRAAMRRALHHPAFWGLAVSFTAYFLTLTGLIFHLIPLLTDRGVPASTIVAAIAVFGPSQMAGRLTLLGVGRRLRATVVGRVTVFAFPAAVLILIGWPSSVSALFGFAVLFGLGNGVMTIVRGTAVPDLIGREGYGAINGALALPATVAKALAPFAAAWLWTAAGSYDAVLWALFAGGVVAAGAYWLAVVAGGRPASKQ